MVDPRLEQAIIEGLKENKERKKTDIQTLKNWVDTTLFAEIKERTASGRNSMLIHSRTLPNTRVIKTEDALSIIRDHIKQTIEGIKIESQGHIHLRHKLDSLTLSWRLHG